MGFDPMSIKYINLAHESGLGTGKPSEIEITGDTEIVNENWHFEVGMSFHKFAGWFTWHGPTRFLQKLLTRPPILYFANFYSFVYHDVIHWPFREGKIYENWLVDSEWGRMFKGYQDMCTCCND
jgi:hypothetical protein